MQESQKHSEHKEEHTANLKQYGSQDHLSPTNHKISLFNPFKKLFTKKHSVPDEVKKKLNELNSSNTKKINENYSHLKKNKNIFQINQSDTQQTQTEPNQYESFVIGEPMRTTDESDESLRFYNRKLFGNSLFGEESKTFSRPVTSNHKTLMTGRATGFNERRNAGTKRSIAEHSQRAYADRHKIFIPHAERTELQEVENVMILQLILENNTILSKDDRNELVEYCINGIPDGLRGRLWRVCSGAQTIIDDNNFKQYYSILSSEFQDYPNPSFHQIEIDLKRTFPDDEYYQLQGVINSIRKILVTYTKRNPLVGYCQGMNFVLGRLIKYLSEEEAFWVFTLLVESILPLDFYTQMIGVQNEVKIFQELLKNCLPQIYKHFQMLGFDAMFFAFNWFVCLFTDKLQENVSLAIIDMIMIQGSHMIHNIGLGILCCIKEEILKCEDFQSLFILMENHQIFVKEQEKLLQYACCEQKDIKMPTAAQIYERRLKFSQTFQPSSKSPTNTSKKPHVTKSFNITANRVSNHHDSDSIKNQVQIQIMKQKFFNNFYLLNGLSKLRNCENYKKNEELFQNIDACSSLLSEHSSGSQTFESQTVSNYKCDTNWPICIYDFTFRMIYPQYYCFKEAEEPQVIHNYFDTVQNYEEEDHHVVKYERRGLDFHADEDFEFSDNFTHQSKYDKTAQSTKRTLDTGNIESEQLLQKNPERYLLLYRGEHYCTNLKFVENFQSLYKYDCTELLENSLVLSSEVTTIQQSRIIMNDFVETIANLQAKKIVVAKIRKLSNQQDNLLSNVVLTHRQNETSQTMFSKTPLKQENHSSYDEEEEKILEIFNQSRHQLRKQESIRYNNGQFRLSPINRKENSRKRPRSQMLQSTCFAKKTTIKHISNQQKLLSGIIPEQNEDQVKNLQRNEPSNHFDALRRRTIRELMQKIDPLTLQENIMVLKSSKNIIFDGVFEDE